MYLKYFLGNNTPDTTGVMSQFIAYFILGFTLQIRFQCILLYDVQEDHHRNPFRGEIMFSETAVQEIYATCWGKIIK